MLIMGSMTTIFAVAASVPNNQLIATFGYLLIELVTIHSLIMLIYCLIVN